MEENNTQLPNDVSTEDEDYELTHTDKLVGVFTEPGETFTKMASEGPKVTDWLFPLILMILAVSISNYVIMSNPQIKYEATQKQMERVEASLQEYVDSGQLTQDQADERAEQIRQQMEAGGGVQQIMQIVGTVIFIVVFFFLVTLYFFLLSKFALKGEGTYASTLSAYGLPMYISVIGAIVVAILSLSMDKLMTGGSLANLIDIDKNSYVGFIANKVDLFGIWFYAVLSIGLAKMFKSESTGKYYAMVFGSWIIVGFIFFYIGKTVPFLSFLNM